MAIKELSECAPAKEEENIFSYYLTDQVTYISSSTLSGVARKVGSSTSNRFRDAEDTRTYGNANDDKVLRNYGISSIATGAMKAFERGKNVKTVCDTAAAFYHIASTGIEVVKVGGGVAAVVGALGVGAAATATIATLATGPVCAGVIGALAIGKMVYDAYSNREAQHEIFKQYVFNLIDDSKPSKDIHGEGNYENLRNAVSSANYFLKESVSQYKHLGPKLSKASGNYEQFRHEFEAMLTDLDDTDDDYKLGYHCWRSYQVSDHQTVSEIKKLNETNANASEGIIDIEKKLVKPVGFFVKAADPAKIPRRLDEIRELKASSSANQSKIDILSQTIIERLKIEHRYKKVTKLNTFWREANEIDGAVFEYMRRLIHFGNYLQAAMILNLGTIRAMNTGNFEDSEIPPPEDYGLVEPLEDLLLKQFKATKTERARCKALSDLIKKHEKLLTSAQAFHDTMSSNERHFLTGNDINEIYNKNSLTAESLISEYELTTTLSGISQFG